MKIELPLDVTWDDLTLLASDKKSRWIDKILKTRISTVFLFFVIFFITIQPINPAIIKHPHQKNKTIKPQNDSFPPLSVCSVIEGWHSATSLGIGVYTKHRCGIR